MDLIIDWIAKHPWFTLLGAVGSISSIWGLARSFKKPETSQTVIAGRDIRGSAIDSGNEKGSQTVVAEQDIIDSPITKSSPKN